MGFAQRYLPKYTLKDYKTWEGMGIDTDYIIDDHTVLRSDVFITCEEVRGKQKWWNYLTSLQKRKVGTGSGISLPVGRCQPSLCRERWLCYAWLTSPASSFRQGGVVDKLKDEIHR